MWIRFLKTGELGSLDTKCQEGLVNLKGKNYPEALECFQKAAKKGCAVAQSILGEMYRKVLGVTQDYRLALGFYNIAADQGNPTAQYNLAHMYYNEYGVSQDDRLAEYWFQKAAEQGHPKAQNRRGVYEA